MVGLALGLAIRGLPSFWVFPSVRDLAQAYPFYLPFTIVAMCVLGVLLGTIVGPKVALWLVNMGNALDGMSTRDKVAVGVGTFIGVLLTLPFFLLLSRAPIIGLPLSALICLAFVYLGIRGTMGMKDELVWFGAGRPAVAAEAQEAPVDRCKLLDTNVIIDGRIADICRAGFVEGTIYVPGFVLDELQHIADSSDSLKRARGRRGLDILNAMQKELPLVVRSYDHRLGPTHGAGEEVDTRLVSLAKRLEGSIVTNDFNLNKVAALQGVAVLNVNELANALKPVVLPGEEMGVTIIREGKEPNQGVAYLDDGTMIVVEDGRRRIGDSLDVTVTSVLQTVAGKMIFARTKDHAGDNEDGHEGGRGRSGSGSRGKVRQS
ncbi:MAG: TRAM domain-containing protein [Chthonomonadales bacterium]|nr:TRAM domain-containing protein [Chthonomonadales bacterium]